MKTIFNDKETFLRTAEAIYANAANKGFWNGERNVGEMIALMHSELSEAHEGGDDHSDKIPEFTCYEEEIGDYAIRFLDFVWGLPLVNVSFPHLKGVAELINFNFGIATSDATLFVQSRKSRIHLLDAHYNLSNILEAYRKKESNLDVMASILAAGWNHLILLSHIFPRLSEAIAAKMEYNKNRPYLHGKKL